MTSVETRLAQLEERLRLLEDHREITALMYSYGPAVDSGCADEAAALWTADGIYDVDTGVMESQAAIRDMVLTDPHQGFIHDGCGHVMAPAYITIDGDTAVGTAHSQLILKRRDGNGYQVSRVTANRWEFARTDDGWRVTLRKGRVLDGSNEARTVLAEGIRDRDRADNIATTRTRNSSRSTG